MVYKRYLTTLIVIIVTTAHVQGGGTRLGLRFTGDEHAWSNVPALRSGSKIIMTLKASVKQLRTFLDADDQQIRVTTRDGLALPEVVNRDDVLEIVVEEPAWRKGAVIGVAAGLVMLGIAASYQDGVVGYGLAMLPVDALWGGLIGGRFSHRRVIYRAP